MQLFRYDNLKMVTTSRDPLLGVLTWVKGVRSHTYLEGLIQDRHGSALPAGVTVRQQADTARSHIALACDYLEQALGGYESVSFLPLYYGLLNLAKTYVILGPYASLLDSQRTHGAQFNPNMRQGGLLDDDIKFWRSGALALFYRSVVGARPPTDHSREYLTIRIGNLYPYITDLSLEYGFATGKSPRLRDVEVVAEEVGAFYRVKTVVYPSLSTIPGAQGRKYLPVVKGLRKAPGTEETYIGPRVPTTGTQIPTASLRNTFPSYLLYSPRRNPSFMGATRFLCRTPVTSSRLQLFEELPIILALFHIGSIVRHHPDRHNRLMDSENWPMLLALRNEVTFRFLVLFWSFVQQTHVDFFTAG